MKKKTQKPPVIPLEHRIHPVGGAGFNRHKSAKICAFIRAICVNPHPLSVFFRVTSSFRTNVRNPAHPPLSVFFRVFPWFLILTLSAASTPIRIDPTAPKPLNLSPEAQSALALAPPLEAPKNVKISQDGTNVTISWDPVPGARDYRVYSAVCVPDSSVLLAYGISRDNPQTGKVEWFYRGSFHPRYGDVYIEQVIDDPYGEHLWSPDGYTGTLNMSVSMYGAANTRYHRIILTPWTPDSLGTYSGTSYTRPLAGEHDRMFHVRSVF